MKERMLVEARELSAMIAAKECVVFDCRFDLQHPAAGQNSWLAAHIPGAVYANLDTDLSGRITARSGRHPLPPTRAFASFLARSGWRRGLKAVAYDAHGGAVAARFWWLMKYYGLGDTLLLDGGISAWMSATLPMESGVVHPVRRPVPVLTARHDLVLNTTDIINGLPDQVIALVDARDAYRFEGESEPIDPVAGHIPGAVNHPCSLNLQADRRFKPVDELQSGFRWIAGKTEPEQLVNMCGSGVTACQNIFAMELAGIVGSRLYVGSWSEWVRNPSRPVATGPGGF